MRGDLRQTNLPEVMRELYAERKSGILQVFRQKIRKRLHFKKGVVIFADSGPGDMQTREQAELLAYSLFTWTSGEYEFLEGESNIEESRAFEGSPSTVILEGSRRVDEPEILERLIGGSESIFSCTKTSVLPLFKMKLSPAENAILTFARARDRFTIEELPLPSHDLPVLSALNALIAVGLLEIVNRPAPAEPEPKAAPPPPPEPQVAPPAPTPAPVAAAPPPQPATAPEPTTQPVPAAPEVPIEMEHLLNTYEAKRAGVTPPPAESPEPAPPIVEAAVTPEPEPPPVPASEPQPVPAAPSPPPASGPSFAERFSSWVSTVGELLPRGRTRLIAGGALALIATAIALVVWLTSSGTDEGAQPDAVVAADSNEPDESPEPSAPPTPRPEPEPVEDLEPQPSEAELFYRANLAFESGEYEKSKAELIRLLELKPDLAVAQDLMAKVEKELAPKPAPPPPRRQQPVRRTPPKPEPEPKPEPKPVVPPPPTPAELFASARNAIASGELERAQAALEELRAADATYPGAQQLQEQIAFGMWKRTLPLAFSSRHDHALGGCDGILTLTSRGIGYGSDDHEWFWSFSQVTETDRRDARRLRVEVDGQSYNFELRESLSSTDWSRYQELRSR